MLTQMECTYARHIRCGRRHRDRPPLKSVDSNTPPDPSCKMAKDAEVPTTSVPFKCEPFDEHYSVEEDIGRGKFAVVKRVIHRTTGKSFAAKFLRRRRLGKDCQQVAFQEVRMLECALGHPHLVHVVEVFQTPREIIIVTEYVGGGELLRHVVCEESFDEPLASRIVKQTLHALAYLHTHNIVHMDVKPQNILLTRSLPDCDVKLCDLGLARHLSSNHETRDIVGTPDYVAPEVLSYEPIHTACDIWSVGVLTYVLLTGCSPFAGDTKQETFLNISQVDLDFPEELFGDVSSQAIHFMQQVLVREPHKRPTAQQCLNHPWIQAHSTESLKPSIQTPLSSPAGHRRSLNSPSVESNSEDNEPSKRCRCDSPDASSKSERNPLSEKHQASLSEEAKECCKCGSEEDSRHSKEACNEDDSAKENEEK